jgi:hypothetical protein
MSCERQQRENLKMLVRPLGVNRCLNLTIETGRDLLSIHIQNEISSVITLLPLKLRVLLDSGTSSLTGCRLDRATNSIRADSCSGELDTNTSSAGLVVILLGSKPNKI